MIKSKLKISIICVCLLTIIIINIIYAYKNLYANDNFVRNFNEPITFYSANDIDSNGNITLKTTEIFPKFREEQLKPKTILGNTSIIETVGSFEQDFRVRTFKDGKKSSMDKYVKIDLENLSDHIEDREDNFVLEVSISAYYYNPIVKKEQIIPVARFEVPKREKTSFVFETFPSLDKYVISISCTNAYPPAYKINIQSGYTLESLGVENISKSNNKIETEKIEPIKSEEANNYIYGYVPRPKDLIIYGKEYNNLNLKINNTSSDDYTVLLYDTSFDIYYGSNINLANTLHKEYKLSKNSTLNENFSNTKNKIYQLYVIPTSLKDEFLNILHLEFKQSSNFKNGFNDENLKNEILNLKIEYNKKFEEITANQQGTIQYKLTK